MSSHNPRHHHARNFDGGLDVVDGVVATVKEDKGGTERDGRVPTVTVVHYTTDVPAGYSGALQTEEAATAEPILPLATPAAGHADPPNKVGSLPPSMVPVASVHGLETGLAVAPIASATHRPTTSTAAAAAPSRAANPTGADTQANDTAAKAGVAIGVLAGILVIGLAVFWFVSRRKRLVKQSGAGLDGDTHHGPPGHASAEKAPPRLSLPAATPFRPRQPYPDRRASRGATTAVAPRSGPAGANLNKPLPGPSRRERPRSRSGGAFDHGAPAQPRDPEAAADPFGNDAAPANPFGDHAERTDEPCTLSPVRSVSPFSLTSHDVGVGIATTADVPSPLASPVEAGFVASSPAPSEHSTDVGWPAAGPAEMGVHRVQLDFAPTLDDELGLSAGELVRLVHEYDDGWALCVRMDRSAQGVVPRTCLSTRALKPRPARRAWATTPQGAPGPSGTWGEHWAGERGPVLGQAY